SVPLERLRVAVLTLPFLVPRHLNRLEGPFVRLLRIVCKVWQFADGFVHVGEPYGQRVHFAELLEQQLADRARVLPSQWHGIVPRMVKHHLSRSGFTSSGV